MEAVTKASRNRTIANLACAIALACTCLGALHFHSTLAFCVFMLGFPGGVALMFVSGVHGDFTPAGGIVFVVVDSVFFYYLFKFVPWFIKLPFSSRTKTQ